MLSNIVHEGMRKKEAQSERGKVILILVGIEEVAPLVEIEMNEEIMETVIPFKYLASCFSKDGGLQQDLKMREGDGLKIFGTWKMMFNFEGVGLGFHRCNRESRWR